MQTDMMILSFDDYAKQSRKLAEALNSPCHIIHQHQFPDGEHKLTLPANVPRHVIFSRSLNQPNEKLIELLLTAKTARQLGAKVLTLVAPYLCYMRQDKAFNPGEVVSQGIIGQFLADIFDNVITIDPHLHRIKYLEQAVPIKNAITLSATSLMAEYLGQHFKESGSDAPVLLGPDNEAEQWVSAVAKPNHWTYGVCDKIRTGDKQVDITLPNIDLNNRTVIIVDDVASSGRTLAVASKKCLEENAKQINILVTHALFVGDAKQQLVDMGVENIWSTDSVSHESNIIALHNLFKDAVLNLE